MQDNRDVVLFNEYGKLQSTANKHDVLLASSILNFWEEIMKPSPEPDRLRSLSQLINEESARAYIAYDRIMSRKTNCLHHFRSRAIFTDRMPCGHCHMQLSTKTRSDCCVPTLDSWCRSCKRNGKARN